MFKNKVLLITGGTGSFGNAVLNRFLKNSISEIRILSRDERKQDDMRRKFHNTKLKFYIGDVRERQGLDHAFLERKLEVYEAIKEEVTALKRDLDVESMSQQLNLRHDKELYHTEESVTSK